MVGNQRKARIIGGTVLALAVVVLFGITYAAFTQTLQINGTATAVSTKWKVYFDNLSLVPIGDESTNTAKVLTAPTIDNSTTSIGNFSVSLTSPGDTISYTFDVVNDGDYNVGISNVGEPATVSILGANYRNIITPVCKVNNDETDTSAVNACKYISYTLKYTDGTDVSTYNPASATEGETFNSSDANGIAAHSRKTMKLTITYHDFSDRSMSDSENASIASDLQSQYDAIDAMENISTEEKTARKNALKTQAEQSIRAGELPTVNVNVSNLGFSIIYRQVGLSTKTN